MGASYGSIHLRSEEVGIVQAALEMLAKENNWKFLMGPAVNGWISLFPSDSGQDSRISAEIAKRLPADIFHLLVHDDDIFAYCFYRDCRLFDEYNSNPDYFDETSTEEKSKLIGKPELFKDLIPSVQNFSKLKTLISADKDKFIFEQERMRQFGGLLGLQNFLSSYEYLQQGEREEIKGWKQFVHIPDLTAEKTARKAERAALRMEKKRLQKEGLLLAEHQPRGGMRRRILFPPDFCFDPVEQSLLVSGAMFGSPSESTRISRLRPLLYSQPEPTGIESSYYSLSSLKVSRNGKWLAIADDKLRLWDWNKKELVNNIQFSGFPIAFSGDEKFLLCQDQQKLFLASLETGQVISTVTSAIPFSDAQALHPSNQFAVTRYRQEQLGILNLRLGKLEKVLFFGTKSMPYAKWMPLMEDKLKKAGIPEGTVEQWKTDERGSETILDLKFSPDGSLLFCGTSEGLRVIEWEKLLASSDTTPAPLMAVVPIPRTPGFGELFYGNFVYSVILDELQKRLLFCGIEGVIRYLNLDNGQTGILLDPPGKSPMSRLAIAPDREHVACICLPPVERRNVDPPRLQIWNYRALCQKAGLE